MSDNLSSAYTAAMIFDNDKARDEWADSFSENANNYVQGGRAEAARRAQVDECVARLIEAAERVAEFDADDPWHEMHTALAALRKAVEGMGK